MGMYELLKMIGGVFTNLIESLEKTPFLDQEVLSDAKSLLKEYDESVKMQRDCHGCEKRGL
jgi:hypothetical protein